MTYIPIPINRVISPEPSESDWTTPAQGKTGVYSSQVISGSPSNAVYDDDDSTSWSFTTDQSINTVRAVWDLGTISTRDVYVKHSSSYQYAHSYIEVSSDNSSWDTVLDITETTQTTTFRRTFRYIRWRNSMGGSGIDATWRLYTLNVLEPPGIFLDEDTGSTDDTQRFIIKHDEENIFAGVRIYFPSTLPSQAEIYIDGSLIGIFTSFTTGWNEITFATTIGYELECVFNTEVTIGEIKEYSPTPTQLVINHGHITVDRS